MDCSKVYCLLLVVWSVTNALTSSNVRPNENLYSSTRSARTSTPHTTLRVNTNKTQYGSKKTHIPYQTTRRQFIPGLLARYQQYGSDQYGLYQEQQDESKKLYYTISLSKSSYQCQL